MCYFHLCACAARPGPGPGPSLIECKGPRAVGPSGHALCMSVARSQSVNAFRIWQLVPARAVPQLPFLLLATRRPSFLLPFFRPTNPDGAGTHSTLLAYLQSASLRPCHVISDGGKRHWETRGGTGTEYELILSHQVTRDES